MMAPMGRLISTIAVFGLQFTVYSTVHVRVRTIIRFHTDNNTMLRLCRQTFRPSWFSSQCKPPMRKILKVESISHALQFPVPGNGFSVCLYSYIHSVSGLF